MTTKEIKCPLCGNLMEKQSVTIIHTESDYYADGGYNSNGKPTGSYHKSDKANARACFVCNCSNVILEFDYIR